MQVSKLKELISNLNDNDEVVFKLLSNNDTPELSMSSIIQDDHLVKMLFVNHD